MLFRSATWFALLLLVFLVFWCEFMLFYVYLLQCPWPGISSENVDKFVHPGDQSKPVKVLLLADTHIGVRHRWLDRARRHWLLNRIYKTAINLYQPDLVLHLGDLLDQGFFEPDEDFNGDVEIAKGIFGLDSKSNVFKVVPGNHDIGFHHRLNAYTYSRFSKAFRHRMDEVQYGGAVSLWSQRGLLFVLVNSMAFEGDGCRFCARAEDELQSLTRRLQCLRGELALPSCQSDFADIMEPGSDAIQPGDYSHPILIQHFPLYRPNETVCEAGLPDSMPDEEREVPYKPGIDCLTDSVTKQLFYSVRPRLAFGAHSHHYCHRTHTVGTRGGANGAGAWTVEEYTLPALSYRVSRNPGFILLHASRSGHAVRRCSTPSELVITINYVVGVLLLGLVYFHMRRRSHFRLAPLQHTASKDS